MKLTEIIKSYIFVRKCVSCDEILAYDEAENSFCAECAIKWNVSKAQTCPTCYKSAFECTCMPKLLSKAGVPCLVKLGFYNKDKYNEPQNKIIYFLKHNKNKRAARFIAKELVSLIKRETEIIGVENLSEEAVITWVPRSKKAKAEEGHDQSELVCRQLSELLRVPSREMIFRKRGAKEQKRLDSKSRSKNIKNSFVFNKKLSAYCGKAVILFDDIVTTGASMSEAVALLRKNGFKAIICVTICSVM